MSLVPCFLWLETDYMHSMRLSADKATKCYPRSGVVGSWRKYVIVKCTLVQALRLCTGRTGHRGSRGIAVPFHDHGTRKGWGSASRPGRSLPSGKDPVPIVQEAGWAPGPVWTGAKNLASTGIRSPGRPVRSQSLYRLSYPAHKGVM